MRLSDVGEYTCLFFVNTTHPYISDSISTMSVTTTTMKSMFTLINHIYNYVIYKLVPNDQVPSIIKLSLIHI